MLPNEARWLADAIAKYPATDVFPMLNLGSSTGDFRSLQQPWIDEYIFRPLTQNGHVVIHTDIKDDPGVDLVGDISNPEFRQLLRSYGIRSVMCSNLLEHVENREELATLISEMVPSGGLIFASCPRLYPYHPDPIDTRFRPTVDELAAIFPATRLIMGAIIQGGRALDRFRGRTDLLASHTRKASSHGNRLAWLASKMRYLPFLIKQFQATCVVLRHE